MFAYLAPDVIVGNSTPVIAAMKQATSSIPIVFASVNDPVGQGFISSLARPGANITGFTLIDFPIIGKWLDMLKDVIPDVSRIALMFNPDTAPYYDVSFVRSNTSQIERDRSDGDSGSQCRTDRDDYRLPRSKSW